MFQPKNVAGIKCLQCVSLFALFFTTVNVNCKWVCIVLVYFSINCYKYLCKYRPIPKTDRTGKIWESKKTSFCSCSSVSVSVIRKHFFTQIRQYKYVKAIVGGLAWICGLEFSGVLWNCEYFEKFEDNS